MRALIAGGWRDAKPYCWIPTKHGYLCWDEPAIVPTLDEAQERVREYEELRKRLPLGVPIPMTVDRREWRRGPLEVVLDARRGHVTV